MGLMKDFDIRIRNGGEDAVAAVNEYLKLRDRVVRLPQAPDDFEISEANGYAAAIVDFKRALAEAGIGWTE